MFYITALLSQNVFHVVIIHCVYQFIFAALLQGAHRSCHQQNLETQPGTQQELICLINACKKVLTTKKCGLSQSPSHSNDHTASQILSSRMPMTGLSQFCWQKRPHKNNSYPNSSTALQHQNQRAGERRGLQGPKGQRARLCLRRRAPVEVTGFVAVQNGLGI